MNYENLSVVRTTENAEIKFGVSLIDIPIFLLPLRHICIPRITQSCCPLKSHQFINHFQLTLWRTKIILRMGNTLPKEIMRLIFLPRAVYQQIAVKMKQYGTLCFTSSGWRHGWMKYLEYTHAGSTNQNWKIQPKLKPLVVPWPICLHHLLEWSFLNQRKISQWWVNNCKKQTKYREILPLESIPSFRRSCGGCWRISCSLGFKF